MKILTVISLAMLISLAGCKREQKQEDPKEVLQQKLAEFFKTQGIAMETRKKIENSTDEGWLEKIASSLEETEKINPAKGMYEYDVKALRTVAFLRLGVLGTPKSLTAIDRIEQQAKNTFTSVCPATIDLRKPWMHPCWHYQDSEIKPLIQTKGTNGKTYAILCMRYLGNFDRELLLASSMSPAKGIWTRPLLISDSPPGSNKPRSPRELDTGEIKDPILTATGDDQLRFSFTKETMLFNPRTPPFDANKESAWVFEKSQFEKVEINISLTQVSKDSDGDGWTDIEEARLGLNPNQADTDGDGIKDGVDITPDYAAQPGDSQSDEVAVIQQAVFVNFGLTGSHHLLLVDAKSRKIQLWGYAGPILYGQDLAKWVKDHEPCAVFVHWEAKVAGDTATVKIMDGSGSLAGGGIEVTLKKKNGKWTAVDRKILWIS